MGADSYGIGFAVLMDSDENVRDCTFRVAALFVAADGCYAGLPGVDAWPVDRDARRYAGPLPVVAHPPCQQWGAMAAVNYARWGGEHNRPGNDGGCFAAALSAVRRWGGVLEHPAKTMAWSAHGLAKPVGIGWQMAIDGGWVCEIWQSAYGHRARKATWLYYYGLTHPPSGMRWDRLPGTHQIGFCDQRGRAHNKPTLRGREASATPLALRDELLDLARMAGRHSGHYPTQTTVDPTKATPANESHASDLAVALGLGRSEIAQQVE